MKRYTFSCEFLADVVLNAETATEGSQSSLDYIPGANFLGIVAKEYENFGTEAYNIFHSGKVSFGDGHLFLNGSRSFKSPLCLFEAKNDKSKEKLWVHHALTSGYRSELTKGDIQLKQLREEWLNSNGDYTKMKFNIAIKSAYDSKKRRSADQKLFSVTSLPAKTVWEFHVDIEPGIDSSKIIKLLEGERNIGRSRSAQFGRILIKKTSEKTLESQEFSTFQLNGKQVIIVYADSNLAFFNEFGEPVSTPTAEMLGFKGLEIDWEKSQLRTRIFAPWNRAVNSRLADRLCIERGSVFILTSDKPILNNKAHVKVGHFTNEGFGKILVNPAFLKDCNDDGTAKLKFKKVEENKNKVSLNYILENDQSDAAILAWLQNAQNEDKKEREIYQKVLDFCRDNKKIYSKITASQWGQIRSLATNAKSNDDLMNKLFNGNGKDSSNLRSEERSKLGFLVHGKMKNAWDEVREKFKEHLKTNEKYGTTYCVRLANQMAKECKEKGAK